MDFSAGEGKLSPKDEAPRGKQEAGGKAEFCRRTLSVEVVRGAFERRVERGKEGGTTVASHKQ